MSSPLLNQNTRILTMVVLTRSKRKQLSIYLPIEILSNILRYLDVHDLLRAITVCKYWYLSYQKVHDELWLNLIRRHYSFVEGLTNKWIANVSNEDHNTTIENSSWPSPSTNWRNQFQRYHSLTWQNKPIIPVPYSPPLLDYIFQVDLVLINSDSDAAENGKPNIVTAIVDPRIRNQIYFDDDDEGSLIIDISPVENQISRQPRFDEIVIFIHAIQRKTSRQAILFNGSPLFHDVEYSTCTYGISFVPSRRLPNYCSAVDLISNRCVCDEVLCSESFFEKPKCLCCNPSQSPYVRCCNTADHNWSCFHSYKICLNLFPNMEEETHLSPEEFLVFLDRGLEYF